MHAGRLKEEKVKLRIAARGQLDRALDAALDAGGLSAALQFEVQDALAAALRRRRGHVAVAEIDARLAEAYAGAEAKAKKKDSAAAGSSSAASAAGPPVPSNAAESAALLEGIDRGAMRPFVPEDERDLWWALLQDRSDEFNYYVPLYGSCDRRY